MKIKTKSITSAIAVLTVAALLAMTAMPMMDNSSGTTRLSNGEYDEERGMWVDGIVGDTHNSYAWCAEVFDDYVWVGTNRDLIGSIAWSLAEPARDSDSGLWSILNGLGLPFPSLPDVANPSESYDAAGKIYRYNLDPTRGPSEWELVWEEAEFSGYRKMLIFNNELYVFAGLTNAALSLLEGAAYIHSAVYRFSVGHEVGTEPQVALWDFLPMGLDGKPIATEFYRAATVGMVDGEEYLFVGTIDGRIFATHSRPDALEIPVAMESIPNYVAWGWEEMGLSERYKLATNGDNRIWDLAVFNDEIYAFVSGNGFMVFKMQLEEGAEWVPVVADIGGEIDETTYPSGLGIKKHAAASPFIMTVDGEEWMYVTTFANGPAFLATMMSGGFQQAFDKMYSPATIYRFNTDGIWEVVVGDYNVAVDIDGVPLNHVGNSKAGFFTGLGKNASSNQYIWWMEEHEGVIYAGTWDMGFFRSLMQLMAMQEFINGFTETFESPEFTTATNNLFIALAAFMGGVEDLDVEAFQTEIATIIFAAIMDTQQGIAKGMTIDEIRADILDPMVDAIYGELQNAFGTAVGDAENLIKAIQLFIPLAAATIEKAADNAVESLTEFLFSDSNMFALYTFDFTNPTGFDLYYSEDGVNFYPYTVNGFGNEYNYGARVLLSTEIGMLVFTANPFGGCGVWVLDDYDLESGITALPESVQVDIGGTAKFRIESTGLFLSDRTTVKLSDGTVATATIEMVDEKSQRVDYWSSVRRMLTVYVEDTHMIDGEYYLPIYVYEVTITGLAEYDGSIGVVLNIGGERFSGSMDLQVSEASTRGTENTTGGDDGGETNWAVVGSVAAAGVIAIVALLYFFVLRP